MVPRLAPRPAAVAAALLTSLVGLAPTAAQPTDDGPPELRVRYDKGVAIAAEDGSFLVRLALRTQIRFEATRPTDDGAEATSRVFVPRARLQLDGNAFGQDTRYKLDYALSDRGSFGFVRDIYVERRLGGAAWLRIGQWKRPFNRQELVSDFASEMNERAITAEFVGGGRDMGIAVHDDYEKSPDGLEWVVGVFNTFSGGADRPVISTDCELDVMAIDCTTPAPTGLPGDAGPTVVARVGWNAGGIKGYSEGDLEGGDLRFAVGAAYKVDLADLSAGAEAEVADNLSHGAQLDALIKVRGFDLQLGVYVMKLKSADAGFAGFVQAGQVLLDDRALIAVRGAVAPTTGDRKQLEARVAFSWLWSKHAWKWVTDAGVLVQTGEDMTGASDQPDLQLRSMAQLTF